MISANGRGTSCLKIHASPFTDTSQLLKQARTQEDSQVPTPMNVVPSLSLGFINSAATRCGRTPSDADGGGGGGA